MGNYEDSERDREIEERMDRQEEKDQKEENK